MHNLVRKFVKSTVANAGQFKQSEIHYKEALKVYSDIDPTSNPAYICLEYYTNALHQQAKTHEAVAKLEEYKKKIVNFPNAPQTIKNKFSPEPLFFFLQGE